MELWLERLKSAPLIVDVYSADTLDILGPHSERIEHMEISYLTYQELATLSAYGFSSLRSLYVVESPSNLMWDPFPRAKGLNRLRLVLFALPDRA